MTSKKTPSCQPVVVPKKYAGRWIVWNGDHTAIVGSGDTLQEAHAAADVAGETHPGFEWVPLR